MCDGKQCVQTVSLISVTQQGGTKGYPVCHQPMRSAIQDMMCLHVTQQSTVPKVLIGNSRHSAAILATAISGQTR